ncbi:hypothetical protein KIPB_017274, partial [Kipferlia bialata]|eukprot:g17274.t1
MALDDLQVDSFKVMDVKRLRGDNLSRAVGRIAGTGGRVKFSIENATHTRMVIADSTIHVLGSHQNVRVAKDALCDLIRGSPASTVYTRLSQTASRVNNRF